ncbi:MAG TPA: hypothetical protein VMS17_22915 [Gemmataceae bacterium]|nr:hypothetical protein [Gemmataceae bacterium]
MGQRLARGWVLTRAAVLAAALGGLVNLSHSAAETTPVHINQTLNVDRAGVMQVLMDVKMAAGQYTQMKVSNPNMAALLRRSLKAQPDWLPVQDFQGSYDDGASTVHFQWSIRGAVRLTADNRYEVPLYGGDDAYLASSGNDGALLTWLTQTPFGQASVTTRVVPPAGSSSLALATAPTRVTFQGPSAVDGTADQNPFTTEPDFLLDVKPQVMSCLAKAMGNPRFSDLWVARATLHNGGGKPATDYRVRFRIKDYADVWSDWKTAARVAPGQDVVDAFFPLFDMTKLSQLEGPQEADLEVEYQFKDADGRLIHQIESRRLKLLDRNEVTPGGLPDDEVITWNDRMNYMPYVLSAFVTHDDPIIQQAAGMVSQRAGGAASAANDEAAMKFMGALYDFMVVNKIAYQTPPVGTTEGEMFQHVKYGRDVLKNKAGTCIDLAIFYASVCDAVGLEPEMVITQMPEGGHCFPVIRLPSGRLVPVETTAVGKADFQKALQVGQETYKKVLAQCPYWQVRVRVLQGQGCSSIELPKLPATALKEWDVVNPETAVAQQQPANNNTPTVTPPVPPANNNGNLVGVWETDVTTNQGEQVHQVIRMTAQGQMETIIQDVATGRSIRMDYQYTYANGVITLLQGGQVMERGTIMWQGPNQIVYETQQGRVVYTRTGN